MKQPPALYVLSCVQMWKFFSQYGMRALLVLYMVQGLNFSDSNACLVSAAFCCLAELGGLFGGMIADRFLGVRRAFQLGALALVGGYLALIGKCTFYPALVLIVVGASLYSGNITALLGEVYQPQDPRREKGFAFLYMMQNLGAFVSTILCAWIAQVYGFSVGFAIAASGMVMGCLTLYLGKSWLQHLGTPQGISQSFSTIPKKSKKQLAVYLGALILFFSVEDQICSSLILFAESSSNRMLGSWEIPSALPMSLNPLVIILMGAWVARKRFTLMVPMVFTAAAFGMLSWVCFCGYEMPIWGIMGLVICISIAELMVGPVVMSYASEVAAYGGAGTVMGMIPAAYSLAYLLSGLLSKIVTHGYASGFMKIALILLCGGVLIQVAVRKKMINP